MGNFNNNSRSRFRFLETLAGRLDLPADGVAGAPKVTVTGTSRVLVENHRGLLAYSDTEVTVDGKSTRVRVRGDGLLLRAMDREMLLVTGTILGVDLE